MQCDRILHACDYYWHVSIHNWNCPDIRLRAVGSLSVILAIFLAVSALGAQVCDSNSMQGVCGKLQSYPYLHAYSPCLDSAHPSSHHHICHWMVSHAATFKFILSEWSSMEQVPDSDSSSSNIRLAGRNLLARPTPKPTKIGTKTAPKAAPTKVALLASSSVQTSGKQGGTGTNSLKAVFKTTKGSAQGTVVSTEPFYCI